MRHRDQNARRDQTTRTKQDGYRIRRCNISSLAVAPLQACGRYHVRTGFCQRVNAGGDVPFDGRCSLFSSNKHSEVFSGRLKTPPKATPYYAVLSTFQNLELVGSGM
eukprot:TRINITY_DN944_c1_g1_i1.p1 TRINITY_DN944_c1_g1~~TRINITY_DN944_c1_g1_i1.p1  ORF type:complete len:107 (-),score=4.20 TRINITY_DN944_c1_g1_i1:77-397(-)